MLRERDHGSVRDLAAKALQAGAKRVSMGHFEWDISGDCESAKRFEYFARPPAPAVKVIKHNGKFVRSNEPGAVWRQPQEVTINGGRGPLYKRYQEAAFGPPSVGHNSKWTDDSRTSLWVSQIVRCGKCARCLRVRQRKWKTRAHIECKRSGRTWFGTLTVSPKRHYQVKSECCQALVQSVSGDFDALPQDAQFARRHAVISREITLWLKRVRNAAKGRLRILLVAEPHEGGGKNHGLPHYHVLIHEIDEGSNVTKAVLEDRWRWGHSHWRLVRGGEANNRVSYLCKYLSKSMPSRIRASIGYGNTSSDIAKRFENPSVSNDPPNTSLLTKAVTRSWRKDVMGSTVLTGSDALSESQHHKLSSCPVQHPWRAAAAERLGGPGSINAFRKLAAKCNARLLEPQNAIHMKNAWLGHEQSPTGPFDYPSERDSEHEIEDEVGPSSACVQARRDDDERDSSGRSNRDQWQKLLSES